MYIFEGHSDFGIVQAVVVGTAAANVGLTALHAAKMGALQREFSARLESDQQKIAFIKYIALRMESIADRLGKNGKYRPGTDEFEKAMAIALKNDMNYKGNCDTDIYYPLAPGEDPKKPRKVWASITRGYVTIPQGSPQNIPPDVGPIWATGCKNAIDQGRMAYISRYKGERKHNYFKIFKEDMGTRDIFLRAATGIIMVLFLIIITKVQRAVLKEQVPAKKKKKKPTQ